MCVDGARSHKGLTWRTALSCESGACAQVAVDDRPILIANSRQPGGPVLEYTPDEWHEFVSEIKKGNFDDLFAAFCWGGLPKAQVLRSESRRQGHSSEFTRQRLQLSQGRGARRFLGR